MSTAVHPGIPHAARLEAGGDVERAAEIAVELTHDVLALVMGASPVVPLAHRGKSIKPREEA